MCVSKVRLATEHDVLAPYQEHSPVNVSVLVSHVDTLDCLSEEEVPELVQRSEVPYQSPAMCGCSRVLQNIVRMFVGLCVSKLVCKISIVCVYRRFVCLNDFVVVSWFMIDGSTTFFNVFSDRLSDSQNITIKSTDCAVCTMWYTYLPSLSTTMTRLSMSCTSDAVPGR